MVRELVVATVVAFAVPAHADCPAAVGAAIAKAFPKSTVAGCKLEREHGHDQYEVRVTKAGGAKAEVDVTPDGKIVQVEEKIALADVPAAVTKAFAAKYPKAKIDGAEKQTSSANEVSYELAFAAADGRHEVTFTADGKLVEEE